MSLFIVLITGDRKWTNYSVIYDALLKVKEENEAYMVISGGASGADELGEKAALMLGMAIRSYSADWKKYGKAAGVLRNSVMIRENRVNLALAFHDELGKSKGTKDMVLKCLTKEVPVRLYKSDGSFVELLQMPLSI